MAATAGFIVAEAMELPLAENGERFSSLRNIDPAADQAILRSMERYGQITPVVVSEIESGGYELIDGFKRLRGARYLSIPALMARRLQLNIRAVKAAIMQLNWVGKSINSMEEALVTHSLYHDDKLSQVEIATLLGRHKSWVCRRIALIDRLDDEVRESIKLGLLPVSMGRELAKLPRGNQEGLLAAVRKHHLTCRETKKVVDAPLVRPEHDHAAILHSPWELLQPDEPEDTTTANRFSPLVREIYRKLLTLERYCLTVSFAVKTTEFGQFEADEEKILLACCQETAAVVEQTGSELRQMADGDAVTCQ